MSNLTYSLLKGSVSGAKPFSSNPAQRPHFHLLIEGGGASFDVAVNIASEDHHVTDVRVRYVVKKIIPSIANDLQALADGVQNLPDDSPLRLDFVDDNLVTKDETSLLPIYDPKAGHTQPEEIMNLVRQAVGNPLATAYAFGHRYDKPRPTNQCWGFSPDDGVHNIHMNQGNAVGNHDDENGRHEDGALWLYFDDKKEWFAVYVAFQTQSWNNDQDGFPVT